MRTEAKEQVEAAKVTALKIIKDGLQTVYKRREHPTSNMSAEIPKDWELHLPEKRSHWLAFAEDMAVYYDDVGDERLFLGFGRKQMGKETTMEDIERIFSSFIQQRGDDFLPLLREYKRISSDTISVGGMSGRTHTYTFDRGGVLWQEQDVHIPHGNAIIVLIYRSPVNIYNQKFAHFQRFIDTVHFTMPSADAHSDTSKKRTASSSSTSSSVSMKAVRRTSNSSMAQSRTSAR
jgi:hypothetical protein